jgi:hypothetical protein
MNCMQAWKKDVMLPQSDCGFHYIFALFCGKIKVKNTPLHKFKFANTLFFGCRYLLFHIWGLLFVRVNDFLHIFSDIVHNFPHWIAKITTFFMSAFCKITIWSIDVGLNTHKFSTYWCWWKPNCPYLYYIFCCCFSNHNSWDYIDTIYSLARLLFIFRLSPPLYILV